MNNILNSTSSYTSFYMRVEEEISPEDDPRTRQSELCSAYNYSSYNPNSSSFNYSPIHQHNLDLPYPQPSCNNNPFPPPISYASDQYDLPLPVAPSIEHSSPLGLELGHCPFYPLTESSWALAQFFKSRGCYYAFGGQLPPRCQAEGCKADLTTAKRYHRRHKVCEPHSKASAVHLGGGIMQRFCQQCSRFHMLDEFDDSKKSCRKRLADHNRRRRKLKPDSPVPSTQAKVIGQQNALHQANSAIPREKEVQKVAKGKGKASSTTRGWLHASICSSKSTSGPSSGA